MVMAFVLGVPLEQNLRASLSMGGGSFSIFAHRPVSLVIIMLAGLILIVPLLRQMAGKLRSVKLVEP